MLSTILTTNSSNRLPPTPQQQPQTQQSSPVSPTSPAETPQQDRNALEMAYAKNDFVPSDEIFFEDLMDNEQLGEFPSMWDLVEGNAEIASINEKKPFTEVNNIIIQMSVEVQIMWTGVHLLSIKM